MSKLAWTWSTWTIDTINSTYFLKSKIRPKTVAFNDSKHQTVFKNPLTIFTNINSKVLG